ncbi:MAG TPA: hypothetical protein VKB31_01895 [Trueperaceae bacterium]|nr:hypothetical protein [Trueperaceae bacterium]
MPDRSPAHLVARLKVLKAHVRHLARDRGLEADFEAELSVMERHADLAVRSDARAMVEAAIEEVRSLARRLAAARSEAVRLGDPRGFPATERAATLRDVEDADLS